MPAQRVPLFLEIFFYEAVGNGPGGIAYSGDFGLQTGAGQRSVLKKVWQLPDFMTRDVALRVVSADGQPRKGVDVLLDRRRNTCGGYGEESEQTDDQGIARFEIDPTVSGVTLMIGGPYSAGSPEFRKKMYRLSETELHQLFTKHDLEIRW